LFTVLGLAYPEASTARSQ